MLKANGTDVEWLLQYEAKMLAAILMLLSLGVLMACGPPDPPVATSASTPASASAPAINHSPGFFLPSERVRMPSGPIRSKA